MHMAYCNHAERNQGKVCYVYAPTHIKNRQLEPLQDEKRVLEGLGEWFRQRQKGLEGLEYYQESRLKRLGLMDDDGQSTFEDLIKINI
jgi:hypothetical protein